MKLRALILSALTLLGLGFVVLLSPAEPAWACSCALGFQQMDERADLILVGTVIEVTGTGIRLSVESVEKGSPPAAGTVVLRVGRSDAGCGYDFRNGARYRVNSVDGFTGLCAGIAQWPAVSPAPGTTSTSTTAADAPVPSPSRWWVVGGASLTVLAAGLVGSFLWRRRTG